MLSSHYIRDFVEETYSVTVLSGDLDDQSSSSGGECCNLTGYGYKINDLICFILISIHRKLLKVILLFTLKKRVENNYISFVFYLIDADLRYVVCSIA